jgi:hypothetical protein
VGNAASLQRFVGLSLGCLVLAGTGCGPRETDVEALVAALSPRRTVEPRLTGQSVYSPCRRAPTEPGKVPQVLCSAQAPTRGRTAGSKPRRESAESLEFLGLEHLLWSEQAGHVERAVRALRSASSLGPRNARIWSDLAAALYVRAQEKNEPQDLLSALDAIEEALALSPALPEARFNRALILDRLYLRGQARAAWMRYLEVDPGSLWTQEAQARLADLGTASTPERWSQHLPALRRAALQDGEEALRRLVSVAPQAAREYAMGEVLGTWGDLLLAGRTTAAATELRIARGIGRALARQGGDETVAEAVAVLDRATGTLALADLARGHRAYLAGVDPFRRLQIEPAAAPFPAARDALSPAGSPVGLWAELGVAGVAFYQYRYEEAAAQALSLLARIDLRRFPALAGRAHWTLGITRLRQGRLTDSLDQLQIAADLFSRAGEAENLGALRSFLAENRRFLGDRAPAWKLRYQALAGLCDYPSSLRLHTLLWEAADAAREEVSPRVALAFQDEDVFVAERSGDPKIKAEALLWRGKIRAASGPLEPALADLDRANRELAQIPSGVVRDKLQIDIAFAHGEVLISLAPAEALSFLDRAISFYRAERLSLNLAVAYLSRARAFLAAGHPAGAEADLDAAIDLFERQRAAVASDVLRLSYSETVQSLFDERLLLEARLSSPISAFQISERARAVPLERLAASQARALTTVPESYSHRSLNLAQLPPNVVFIEYAWTGDRLFCWTVRRSGIDFEDLDPRGLNERIQELYRAVTSGSPTAVDEAASALYVVVPRAARALPAGLQLFFVPDKALNGVPFAALRNPATGHYLIEEHVAVGVVPSVQSYLRSRARGGVRGGENWRAFLIGNPTFDRGVFGALPDLPWAEREVAEVKVIYPGSRVLLGADATRENLLADLDRWEILEFAGHAIDDPQHPAYSRLVLAPSSESSDLGALFAHEIGRLRLKTLRLVVLNACHTIAARDLRIGGLSGLARTFLDAGAQAVVGTLWDVNDAAARRMLPEFHRRFRITGDATLALAEAQRANLRSDDSALRSPAAWGAFQVVGAIPVFER